MKPGLSQRLFFFDLLPRRNIQNNNVPEPEQLLMNWLGHRQSAMVKHYYHVDHKEAARQMSGLNLV